MERMSRADQAVILAAGRGSRMGMMTESFPKCMVELAGRSLIEWQIESLHAAGVSSVSLVVGYKGKSLENYELPMDWNKEWEDTNMVISLMKAKKRLQKSPTIISYSDIVYHPEIVNSLIGSYGDIVITYDRLWHDLWSVRFDNPLDDAESFREEGGFLQEIGGTNPQLSEVCGQYMGLLLITPNGWSQIEKVLESHTLEECRKMDMTTLLRSLLKNGVEIKTVGIDGKWCEVDSGEDRTKYIRKLEGDPNWSHDWRW